MRIKLFSLILGSLWVGHSTAANLDYSIGFESQLSRSVVQPSFFPILNAGILGSSERSNFDLLIRSSIEHPSILAITSKCFFYQLTSSDSTFQFSIGRKWTQWSEGDEIWGLGIVNPLDAWDRLRYRSQGLTGLFGHSEGDWITFDFFASYLTLPETMPNVVIENDQFKFHHPQSVSAGPQTFDLLNQPTPLGYKLLIPEIGSILLRPSLLASFSTRKEISSIRGRLTAGYLPLNYFPVALDASLSIPINTIVVNLRPRLLHHAVYSAEVAYEPAENAEIGFSVIKDQIFTEKSLPSDYTTASLGSTMYYTPWIRIGSMRISHLYSEGGLGADIGPYSSQNQNVFSSRILYRNATQLSLTWGEWVFRLLHEYSVNANWIAMDWNHSWDENWSTVFGGDLISAEKLSATNRGAEFLPDLRALDRIRLGVKYVF
jgi:hypothetical protein